MGTGDRTQGRAGALPPLRAGLGSRRLCPWNSHAKSRLGTHLFTAFRSGKGITSGSRPPTLQCKPLQSVCLCLSLSASLKLLRSTCLCLPSAKMKGRTIMPTKPTQNTRLRPDSSVASQEERRATISEHGQDTDHTVSNSQHPTRQRSHGAQDKRCLKYHFNKTGKAEQARSRGTSQEAALARASLKAARRR